MKERIQMTCEYHTMSCQCEAKKAKRKRRSEQGEANKAKRTRRSEQGEANKAKRTRRSEQGEASSGSKSVVICGLLLSLGTIYHHP
jgi:hypothetical protein